MDNELGTSRPKIHRLPNNKVDEGGLYVSRAVLIVCVALVLVAVIPALWSFRTVGKAKVAQTMTPAQAQIAAPTSTPDPDNLMVRDANGTVVGQLAKMPADAEHSTSINTTSKVDPNSGKELMNIIGKY